MEEESFTNEEYIATEGQLGEKFFIVVLGNVSTYIIYRGRRRSIRRICRYPARALLHFLKECFS